MEKIRSRCDRFFLCKAIINYTDPYGKRKKELNQYVIDASCWAEAEYRIIQHLKDYWDGPEDLQDISIAQYNEIFFTEGCNEGLWFSAKLDYEWIDDWTGKAKHTTRTFLVPAADLDAANKLIDDILGDSKEEYTKTMVKDACITEVIEHKNEE